MRATVRFLGAACAVVVGLGPAAGTPARGAVDDGAARAARKVIVDIAQYPETGASLTLSGVKFVGSTWKATAKLTNTGGRTIREYDVSDRVDYQFLKGSSSSIGWGGQDLKPGESVEFPEGGGFPDGLSYGKPVGRVVGVHLTIERLAYGDGSTWKRPESGGKLTTR